MPHSEACVNVRRSASLILSQGKDVEIDQEGIINATRELRDFFARDSVGPAGYHEDWHLVDGTPLTAQYFLVVDALNFCFWPDEELEYEHLARGVKAAVAKDPKALEAAKLAKMDGPGVRELFGWTKDVPLQEERARLLREVGVTLQAHFGGSAARLVEAANKSASKLVGLLAQYFPGFRDSCIWRGQQVFFYKRAQIFCGDIYGAFNGKGLGEFEDLDQLTMFADYRVPVTLKKMGVLKYSPALEAKIKAKEELAPGSEAECQIRAASIMAVERLREGLQSSLKSPVSAVEVDWRLWHLGEAARLDDPPHHRTLSIFY